MSDLEYPLNANKSVLNKGLVDDIDVIADWSYSHNWKELLKVLNEDKQYINHTRLAKDATSPPKLFTPLHQAAYGKAPKTVIETLLGLGASKTLKTAEGKTSYDIAVQKGMHQDILDMLQVPEEIKKNEDEIKKMEKGLHDAILGRVKDLIEKNNIQLPQLSFLYEFGDFWFPVPGITIVPAQYGDIRLYQTIDRHFQRGGHQMHNMANWSSTSSLLRPGALLKIVYSV